MRYDDILIYDSNNITYNGTLVINVPGITDPLRINDVSIVIVGDVDYSNYTSGGSIQIDLVPTSEISFTLTDVQAIAIMSMDTINISVGAETYYNLIDIVGHAEGDVNNISLKKNSELSLINISTEGTLLIPNS